MWSGVSLTLWPSSMSELQPLELRGPGRGSLASYSFPTLWAVGLGAIAVSLMFTALSLWLYAYRPDLMPFPPFLWVALVGGGGLVLLLFRQNWQVLWATPLLYWVLAFLSLNVLAYFLADGRPSADLELISAIITVTVLVSITLISAEALVQDLMTRMIFVATLVAVVLNIYDLFFPLSFSKSFGRSAGFYVNPNISGYAICAGMLVALRTVQPRLRPWFVICCGAGVILTLSRGGMLNWGMCVGLLIFRGVLGIRHLLRAGALLLFLGLAAMTMTGRVRAVLDNFNITDRQVWERLTVSGDAAETDVSVQTRKLVARKAWETFAEHPMVGAGLGATRGWDVYEDTHNIYLKHLAEFGVLGPFIFLLFAVSVTWGGKGELRVLGQAFALDLVLQGALSHNVLEERSALVSAGVMAAVMARNRLDQRGAG